MAIEAGQILLNYRLIEKIGEGGMGVVWKAEDTRLHRSVALKFVPEGGADEAGAVDRQLREARSASALNHPNICSIYDIVDWEDRRFIVMELLEGRTLQKRIGGRPLEVEPAVDLALQIADALTAAHAKGIVHRDVKTANIFVVDDGSTAPRVKLLDFGLAKLAVDSTSAADADSAAGTELEMTKPGTLVGTAAYMSPEQALGKELDARTDIFSLGVVLYEMITGRRAFGGNTSAAVFDAILNRSPTAPVELNRRVPQELERIINKTLEKDPSLRYQSAAGLAADLKRLRRDSSTAGATATPPPPAYRSGRRWIWLAMALAVSIVAITFILGERPSKEGSRGKVGGPGPAPRDAGEQKGTSRGPSIAVLPFENASGDPDQEYFSDGLTEAIISELSRYSELSVIARSSTARHKGSEEGVQSIGAALNARYVLEGTVRKAGNKVRVGVQLSDAHDGRSVWGTSYERDLTALDLFELQDELTQQVVNAIAGSYGALARAELPGARSKPPSSLDSYDCVLRVYQYLQAHVGANHLAARQCLEQVVEEDPDYADGLAWLAYLYAEEYHHRRNERPEEYVALDRALEFAERAVGLDDSNSVSHGALMITLFLRGDDEQGRIEAMRTVDLSPSNALWLALAGVYLAQDADYERGIPLMLRARELMPYPPGWIEMGRFMQEYHEGRDEEAVAVARRLEMGEDFRGQLFLAASLGQLGRVDDASPSVEEFEALWTGTREELRRELVERNAMSEALVDRLLDGLEKAGFDFY